MVSLRFGLAAAVLVVLLAVLAACGTETVVERTVEVPVTQIVTETERVEVPVTQIVTETERVEVPVTQVVTEVVTEEIVITETITETMTEIVEVPLEQLPPLVIGNLNAFTGSLAAFGPPLRNSVALAADHINRAGGIQGGSVIIISRDTGANPVQGVDAARALVDVENVAAIVGALSSGVTVAVANSVTVPNERLLISGASTAPSITVLEDNDYLFRTVPTDAGQGKVLARLAMEEGYDTIGIMYLNNDYGVGLADQFEETFTALGGTVSAKVPHEDVQPTYVSELTRATEGDPDALLTLSYPDQAQVYVREALEGEYIDTFLMADGLKVADWIDEIDVWEALDGMVGTVPGGPDRAEKSAFEDSYTETYGFAPSHPFMAEHYDATVLVALAAAKAGSTTDSAAIRDALREVANAPGEIVGPGRDEIARAMLLIANGQDINYEGAGGIVDIDENGDVFGPIEIWQVKDGEIQSTGRFETP